MPPSSVSESSSSCTLHELLRAVPSLVAAKPCFLTSAVNNLLFWLAAAAHGSVTTNTGTSISKAEPHMEVIVCIWNWSRLIKSSFSLHMLKQEPGNIFKAFFFFFFLIPAYSFHKGLAICKHPQSIRCVLSICFLRFQVCLHYDKTK